MAKNIRLPGVGKISQIKLAGEHFNLEPGDIRSDSPVRACEHCGFERPSSDMINFIAVIGCAGRHGLEPFQHPEEEHWSCSIDCWVTVAHRVVEDMKNLLVEKHTGLEESVHDVTAREESQV